jgi:uncharacterized protein (DUF697 family)
MKRFARKIYEYVINPPSDESLVEVGIGHSLPTIWLLGKTGAGKSSIVQKLTGQSRAQIGNGFMPCTRDYSRYDYPDVHPIVSFLDTRGLGEADYDPGEDIAALMKSSHAVLLVVKLRDPERNALLNTLKQLRKSAKHIRSSDIAVVHTGVLELPDADSRKRAIALCQKALEDVWGDELDYCEVDFADTKDGSEPGDVGFDELVSLIGNKLPALELWLQKSAHKDAERESFDKLSSEVLWYSTTAAATDAVPIVGLVSVPAIQGKMLHSLAQKYGIEWSAGDFGEFISTLGTSFAVKYAINFGGRQLGKLIPGYGQIVGSAFAATISFTSTYALGRVACMYLYHKQKKEPLNQEDLRSAFVQAMTEGKSAGQKIFDVGKQ